MKPKIVNPKSFLSDFNNKTVYRAKQSLVRLVELFELREKVPQGLFFLLNTFLTGWLLWYAIHNDNPISWGIWSAMIPYYIAWLLREIGDNFRRPPPGNTVIHNHNQMPQIQLRVIR